MAVPAVLGRRGPARIASDLGSTTAPMARVRRGDHRTAWIVLGLAFVALLSRVYTTNSLAGEPTSDEYLYAIHARDLARDWTTGGTVSLDDLGVEGRSVAIESAALSFVIPWDPLTIGRTLQAAFNALCIPMTFVLGCQVGLRRSAALAGALLLMAVPEFQESAWRFWTDSQATLIVLVYLASLVTWLRRPAVLSGILSLLALALLLLTKESAAVTFAPLLALGILVALRQRLGRTGRARLAVATVLVLACLAGLGWLVARAPADLRNSALLQKTFGAGPLVLTSVRDAVPRLPAYSDQLITLIGPRELGTGFLVATLVGLAWLVAQSVLALVTARPRRCLWVSGWVVAAVVWGLAMVTPARDLASVGQSDPWVVVAAASLLVIIGSVALCLHNTRPSGWGLALLGLVVLAVLSERLIISVTPKVSGAALTFRSLMPIVPLFAVVAGGGLWAMAGALALLLPSLRAGQPLVALLASVGLVVFWSPLLRERLSTQPLLGRVADRGADPDTPQGLRVETLVEAQGWLQANLEPSDVTMVGVGLLRHLAWYADLGVDGMSNLIDLGSHPEWTPDERRAFELERVGPTGADFVVDFNVNWTDPDGEAARQWRQTYEQLASRPNLETAYLKRDKFGYPVFYVMRNYGYAVAPGH